MGVHIVAIMNGLFYFDHSLVLCIFNVWGSTFGASEKLPGKTEVRKQVEYYFV